MLKKLALLKPPLEQISFHLGNLFEVEVPCSNHLEDILEVEIEDTDLS